MSRIVIERPEADNISGIYRRLLLMPLAAITEYAPGLANFVDPEDFSVNDFNPTIYVLEAIPNTPIVSDQASQTPAGQVHNLEFSFRVPSHSPMIQANLRRLMQIRYFVVFFRDFNTETDNKRWRVWGTKENPMELSYTQRSSPMDQTLKLTGQVENLPWFDINLNPEDVFM